MSKIVVDTELNGESENPIANKAVYEAIQQCKANQEEIGKFFENGKLSHTLTIGNTIYDGTKDVIIKVYDGEKNIKLIRIKESEWANNKEKIKEKLKKELLNE